MSYQIMDDVLARSLGDAVVLFQPETERLLTLNESGSRIWELLSERASTAQIIAQLCEEYAGPEHVIQQEVQEFLLKLERERLIRPQE
jgi:Coenzyme PQQ synthesis protein D (PqqD)